MTHPTQNDGDPLAAVQSTLPDLVPPRTPDPFLDASTLDDGPGNLTPAANTFLMDPPLVPATPTNQTQNTTQGSHNPFDDPPPFFPPGLKMPAPPGTIAPQTFLPDFTGSIPIGNMNTHQWIDPHALGREDAPSPEQMDEDPERPRKRQREDETASQLEAWTNIPPDTPRSASFPPLSPANGAQPSLPNTSSLLGPACPGTVTDKSATRQTRSRKTRPHLTPDRPPRPRNHEVQNGANIPFTFRCDPQPQTAPRNGGTEARGPEGVYSRPILAPKTT